MSRCLLAAVVAALCLAGGAGAEPSRKQYLAHVSSVCLGYARRLERVPAPSDPGAYGNVISSLRQVLPLLRGQERAMRAIPAPPALRLRLGRLFALDRRSIADLGAALAAAGRRDAGGVATGLGRFSGDRERVHAAAVGLGIRCEPN
jgi:hypothetical protein